MDIVVNLVDGSSHDFQECFWSVDSVGLQEKDPPQALFVKSALALSTGPERDVEEPEHMHGMILAAFPWERVQGIHFPTTRGQHEEARGPVPRAR